jgi:hypothetical protein
MEREAQLLRRGIEITAGPVVGMHRFSRDQAARAECSCGRPRYPAPNLTQSSVQAFSFPLRRVALLLPFRQAFRRRELP